MGMNISPKGQIVSLKSGAAPSGHLANGGVYWVNPRVLLSERFSPGDKLSLEDDFFVAAMDSGRHLSGIEVTGIFIDIGVPDDYHRAPALLG